MLEIGQSLRDILRVTAIALMSDCGNERSNVYSDKHDLPAESCDHVHSNRVTRSTVAQKAASAGA